MKLLDIENLSVAFAQEGGKNIVAEKISFGIDSGQMIAIVGESGSGKSVTALSILKLLPYPAASHPTGKITLDGEDILSLNDSQLCAIRGNKVGMIFQEPMTSLNPLHTISKQIKEAIYLHNPTITRKQLNERVVELLGHVELGELEDRLHSYPHELSGGQRQRIMIAMALANEPDLLIADEPTTALDVTVQAHILRLLKDLQKKLKMAILLISHDLTIVERLADQVIVMHEGRIVEHGNVKDIFKNPQHDYTKHLLSSAPKGEPVRVLKKLQTSLLNTKNLKVYFPKTKNFFGKATSFVKAVDGVDVNLKSSQTLGIVGESGSGKTTLAMALLRLIDCEGDIYFQGQNISKLHHKKLRPLRKQMQVVFQDPFSSLNPRMSIAQIVEEGLLAHQIGASNEDRQKIIDQSLTDAGLSPRIKTRYPHEFSGGQRQRIGIARALALNPKLIVLDEPTSALDLSTQSEILDMLKTLQKEKHLSYIFISHDLRVIKSISHEIMVMKNGHVIEFGDNTQIFTNPKTDYTKQLIRAAFDVEAI